MECVRAAMPLKITETELRKYQGFGKKVSRAQVLHYKGYSNSDLTFTYCVIRNYFHGLKFTLGMFHCFSYAIVYCVLLDNIKEYENTIDELKWPLKTWNPMNKHVSKPPKRLNVEVSMGEDDEGGGSEGERRGSGDDDEGRGSGDDEGRGSGDVGKDDEVCTFPYLPFT